MASQYFGGYAYALLPQACLLDTTAPSGGEISALTANADGSLQVTWNVATDVSGPISYDIFIQKNTATGLFSSSNIVTRKRNGLTAKIYTTADDVPIQAGATYYIGVRAVDVVGNSSTNTTSMSVVASYVNYGSLASAVWNEPRASHVTSGTFGEGVEITSSARSDIAVAVEAALLNDGDGQALLAAIVAAIGNQNVDQIALIAAIRADIERVGGPVLGIKAKTDNLPADPASDTQVNTRLASSGYTAPDNSGIAAIKAKTDNLPATPANETTVADIKSNTDLIPGLI